MEDHLIKHYQEMSISELLNEIVTEKAGMVGSSKRDCIEHILKIKIKEREQLHNKTIIKYVQKNHRLNFFLSVSTIILAISTIGILYFGSNGIKEHMHQLSVESTQCTK